MSTSPNQRNNEQPSTYVVQNRESQSEFTRLMLQDHLLTTSMGGVLAEVADPTRYQRILDIACGPGAWCVEVAQTYPNTSVVGVDISRRMIAHARTHAETQQVSQRVEFHIMDALSMLEFPDASFDLVNMRLGGSFLRTWDWPKLLSEMLRIARPAGLIRITDQEIMHQNNSPAGTRINEMVMCAFYRAGHLFANETTGITAHLPALLTQHGCTQVQSRLYALHYQAGTPEGQMYSEDMAKASQTLRPFLQKWGCISDAYDDLYQASLQERQQPDFHSTWNFLCVWGTRPSSLSS
ncbi:MAG TPA: methyltransferase domain-containing protein [Ktedonobacteraceae bacterium]